MKDGYNRSLDEIILDAQLRRKRSEMSTLEWIEKEKKIRREKGLLHSRYVLAERGRLEVILKKCAKIFKINPR